MLSMYSSFSQLNILKYSKNQTFILPYTQKKLIKADIFYIYVNVLINYSFFLDRCVICLADYKEKEALRIIPKCGHTFHRSCIDMWLRKQSTCPVCRLSLQNASETKHMRHVTFTIRHSLDESNSTTSERNTNNERQVEPNASNSLQSTLTEPEARH